MWRLIVDEPATGAENMAVDEAITQGIAAGLVAPTLRFYAWSPPCVSMGRNQAASGIDLGRCAARGYDVVRRPTGGRAILHTDEMTYSIVASPDNRLMQGYVLDSYLRISHGLVAGLRSLGIDAQEAPGTNRAGPDVSAACFEVPSAYEIVAGTRKILGSAQARRSTSVLQHGSLPLVGDLTRVVDCLAFEDEAEREALRASLKGHAATVEELLGRVVSYEEAVRCDGAGDAGGAGDRAGSRRADRAGTRVDAGAVGEQVRARFVDDAGLGAPTPANRLLTAEKVQGMQLREYTAAGGVVLDDEGRVLLIERWVERNGEIVHEVRLPKGHVDPGETDAQAALRETCEESGYCSVEVIGDLGTIVTEFDKATAGDGGEHVRRTEHYFLMRLTDKTRSEPNFQSPDEARFLPKWAAKLDAAERLLTYDSEKRFAGRARAFLANQATPEAGHP